MQTLEFTCERCGSKMTCPESDVGKKVLCEVCLRYTIVVPAFKAPDKIELESDSSECMRAVREDFFKGTFKEAEPISCSHATPAAPPTQPKDADKALTNVALGIFRLNNWPCQEDEGYRSFVARVKFRSSQLGITTVDNFRVYGDNGLLMLESPVIELPASLPGVPILETLNEINQRSVSAVFVRNEQGVVMRHGLIPHLREQGFINAAMLLQTLRQMNHDRRHALSLLRQAVETRRLDPLSIARAFAQPMAASRVGSLTLDQLADLAGFAGFHVHNTGSQIAVSHDLAAPDKCPLRMTACPGFVRAWVTMGDTSNGSYTWNLVPKAVRAFIKSKVERSGKLAQLYEHLNELNKISGVLRVVSTQKHVVATTSVFPADQPLSVEQFRVMSESLLAYIEANAQHKIPAVAKLAG